LTSASTICWLAPVLFLGLPSGLVRASRVKDYSLSECVAKADIIIAGLVRKREENGDVGILTVTAHVLKGPAAEQRGSGMESIQPGSEIRILFHPGHEKSLPGAIPVEPRHAYFFFLKAVPDSEGRYSMFDPYDGVIQTNGPVRLEIMRQLRKAGAAPGSQTLAETKRIELIASEAVAKNDAWAHRAVYRVHRKENGTGWMVTAWRITGYNDDGKPQFVPGGHRLIEIDAAGNVAAYMRGR